MSMVTHLEELCFIKWNTSPHSFTKPTKDPLWKDVVSPWEESRNWPITAAPSFGFISIPTRLSPWRRKWQPTPVLLPGKSHGQRRQEDYSPWGGKESDTIEWLNSSVQSLSRVRLFATPWTSAHQASLSITNSWSPPKPMSIESVMPSNYLILCRPLLFLPSIFPSIRVFSNESALRIRWPKDWSFSFNTSPSSEHPGLISFRMDWLDLLAVQATVKSLESLEWLNNTIYNSISFSSLGKWCFNSWLSSPKKKRIQIRFSVKNNTLPFSCPFELQIFS